MNSYPFLIACRMLEEERHRRDQVVVDDDIVSDLRAALDVERSSALELTTRLEQVENAAADKLKSQQALLDELQQQINKLLVSEVLMSLKLCSEDNLPVNFCLYRSICNALYIRD